MRERKLTKVAVAEVIASPVKIVAESPRRWRAVKRLTKGGKTYLLVVIYDIIHGKIEVVTIFLTSKIKKYLTDED